jgi:hypothetical protein
LPPRNRGWFFGIGVADDELGICIAGLKLLSGFDEDHHPLVPEQASG